MKPLLLTFSHDDIFKGVKQEASLYAERQLNRENESLFDELVFDEEYFIKFRELFFDAQADVVFALSAYMKDVPYEGPYFESADFSENRDFILTLALPDNFAGPMCIPLNTKIKEYLIAYIMYRWLETKAPADAERYKARTDEALANIKSYSNKAGRAKRQPRWF